MFREWQAGLQEAARKAVSSVLAATRPPSALSLLLPTHAEGHSERGVVSACETARERVIPGKKRKGRMIEMVTVSVSCGLLFQGGIVKTKKSS